MAVCLLFAHKFKNHMSRIISIFTTISRSLRVFLSILACLSLARAEDIPPQYSFSIVMINMNGVPDIVRLPNLVSLKPGEFSEVSLGDKRWEENFYFIIESPAKSDLPWKIQQRQINCLVDPADSTLLKSWPNRVTEWRDLSFVGTNRYRGNLFLEKDLNRLTREELEAHVHKIGGPYLSKNLEIVSRLVSKPEGNSYHCRAEFRVSVAENPSSQNALAIIYSISVDNF